MNTPSIPSLVDINVILGNLPNVNLDSLQDLNIPVDLPKKPILSAPSFPFLNTEEESITDVENYIKDVQAAIDSSSDNLLKNLYTDLLVSFKASYFEIQQKYYRERILLRIKNAQRNVMVLDGSTLKNEQYLDEEELIQLKKLQIEILNKAFERSIVLSKQYLQYFAGLKEVITNSYEVIYNYKQLNREAELERQNIILDSLYKYFQYNVNLYNLQLEATKEQISARSEVVNNKVNQLKKISQEIEQSNLANEKKLALFKIAEINAKKLLLEKKIDAMQYEEIIQQGRLYKVDLVKFEADLKKLSANIQKFGNAYKIFEAKMKVANTELQVEGVKQQINKEKYRLENSKLNSQVGLDRAELEAISTSLSATRTELNAANTELKSYITIAEAQLISQEASDEKRFIEKIKDYSIDNLKVLYPAKNELRLAEIQQKRKYIFDQMKQESTLKQYYNNYKQNTVSDFNTFSEEMRAKIVACANVTANLIHSTGG